ncbi:uncharacterized protein LOC128258262 isoform X1 [Drosophila gunungcola]|uniref:uncharacterized protein LOC128258262 isoform X1 n=1 Tax=Drosophila gunungcola TaxID=103775 RepID=UPI0022E0626E|nr:uncharacterized protein LOC128258262 isoform X1 [Drosophila gunungcola]XP_052845752.1 uncharacterized protein LOC128258262 isoform X1 [Drosophila gunungcola]XP_052845753.1 uncharacterized protein LOC128258262 isoform X1 [Drosophila gunungcola]
MVFGTREWNFPKDNLLRMCFLISAFELLRSLYFSFSSVTVMISHTNYYTIIAFLSTVAWILTVIGLFVGLSMSCSTLLVFWLLFSGFATVTDIIFLIWNVTSSPIFDVDHFKHWTISYLGIFYECTCLYLVFRYFQRLCSYCLLEGCNYGFISKVTQKTVTETLKQRQFLQLQAQILLKIKLKIIKLIWRKSRISTKFSIYFTMPSRTRASHVANGGPGPGQSNLQGLLTKQMP